MFLLKFSQTNFMAFQLGTERFLDGIANYLIKFGLCLKINQSSLWRIDANLTIGENVSS